MAETLKLGNGIWGTKDGSLLAYNNESGNYKPLPFDFTRASSATVVNKAGLIETVQSGIPRIDFLGNTNGALLLEPQRTNLITNSEQFVEAPTGATNMDLFGGTIINNDTISPDGNVSAMKFTTSAVSGALLRIYQSDLSTSSDTTFSIYAKKGTTDSLSINITGGTSVISTLTDEWQRISVTDISTSNLFIDVAVSGNAGEYIYIWGLQAEQASYPTSYIPTQGSTVTRVQDACSQTPPSGIIGQTEGTMFLDFTPNTDTISTKWLSFLGGNTNYIGIYVVNTSNVIRLEVADTTNQATFNSSFSIVKGQQYKCAIAYANNDFTAYINGVQLGTVTSGSVPTTSTLKSYYNLSNIESTNTNDLRLYNTRLSNSELATLTSL